MDAILKIENLTVDFKQSGRQKFRAVDNVSLAVKPRTTLGLVGESGSGKSTIGRVVLGLLQAIEGTVKFQGESVNRPRRELAASLQAIFQDPYSSLNPLRTIGQTLAEPLRIQRIPAARHAELIEGLLKRVSLPADSVDRYPHEFSGGQRQRIAIARALLLRPALVVCDEPISALDLSTQAAVLNLLQDLQDEFDVAYLFIAHDLVVVRHISDQVVVLYRGQIMESGPSNEVCDDPLHPYSQALWSAAPVPDPEEQATRREVLLASSRQTDVGETQPRGVGCPFAARCPFAEETCRTERPRTVQFESRQIQCAMFDPDSSHSLAGEGGSVMRSSPISTALA